MHTRTKASKAPVQMRCKTCNGTNVMRDAWAEWDDQAQKWELKSVFDAAYCDDCNGECTIVERTQ